MGKADYFISINIVNNDFDKAIEEAKSKNLISKNIYSLVVKKQLVAASIELAKYDILELDPETGKKKKKKKGIPKPPPGFMCEKCGGSYFGVCILGGCFEGYKWTFPL